MARFNGNQFENYSSNTGGKFFSLKDDKEVAQVRFLYNGIEDITGIAVHEIQVNGNRRYVSCLREYNEPVDNCPLCQQGSKVIPKLYIPLLVYPQNGEPEVQLWERGKAMYNRLSSLASRYQPLCGTLFEIERNGKRGEQTTKYEIYPIETDNCTLEQIINPEEITDPVGTIILDKNYDEIVNFLNTGNFDNGNSNDSYRPRGQQTNVQQNSYQPQRQSQQPYTQHSYQPQQQPVNNVNHVQGGQQSRFANRGSRNSGDVF